MLPDPEIVLFSEDAEPVDTSETVAETESFTSGS